MFARRARLPVVSPPLCPNCDDMPILPNPATGGYFNYCSRTCATQARQNRSNQQPGSLCEQCKLRPKFSNGTHAYRYCGRTCARLAANSTSNQTNLPTNPPVNPPANPPVNLPANPTVNPPANPPPANPPPANPPPANPPPANPPPANPLVNPPVNSSVNPPSLARPSPPQPASSGQTCRTPKCKRPVFVHQDGTPSDYCMMTHKKWGEHGCISCRAAPRSNASVLCQSCHGNELKKAPAIVQVPGDHNNYKSVESQFKQSWRHKTACPEVKAIYKVISTEASLKQYDQYLDDVETRGNFATDGKSRGNEHRRWHGTTRKCKLGDTGNSAFCADAGCPLCCIIKSSFDLKFFKAATGWGRFGQGIYTSSTSSKSNDYSKNMGINSDWKALLLNKVVVGKGKKLTQNDTSLTAPPQGYDSVLAEVGGVLNYDELVVYNNDAVRPSYLIMYKSP